MTVKELHPGQSGIVAHLGGEGPLRRRMIDMGITPGARIKVMMVAPLGDPVKVILRGYELSLRKDDAARIEILESSVEGKK